MSELTHGGRKPLLKALVGSHNYNLNVPESDKDYKIFVAPSFDDLYTAKTFANNKVSDTVDYDVHDIRKLTHLFFKANVNYLEVLYSTELEILVDPTEPEYKYLKTLIDNREAICKMNMKYLYEACVGMHMQRKGHVNILKQHLAGKEAMTAYRILDFLLRYKNAIESNVDHPFKVAMRYSDEEREKLLNMRRGVYSHEQLLSILDAKLKIVESSCKEYYKSKEPREGTKNFVDNQVKQMIKEMLLNQFREEIIG